MPATSGTVRTFQDLLNQFGNSNQPVTAQNVRDLLQTLGNQVLAGAIASLAFAAAAGAANVCNVTVTPKDADGNALTGIRELELWLSDAATGAGLTGTDASGTVTNKASEGTVLTALTAKKHILVQAKAAGTFVLEITDAAKTGFYVCARIPGSGLPSVSTQLQTADYGA